MIRALPEAGVERRGLLCTRFVCRKERGVMHSESARERVAAWVERKRGLPVYGFYTEAVAKEVGLPRAIVEVQIREMVVAGEIVVRFWEVYCGRCDQAHEFPNPQAAEDEICLRCGAALDPAQAVPLYGLRREV